MNVWIRYMLYLIFRLGVQVEIAFYGKILGYFTPEELFDEFLDQVYALKDV